ncbi:unannotated protein [freshwater metagenome]|uniref:Unannotated protein n=1 Tax=freshwater metagenome TaxID=449393 RepID=A0A6J5YE74_9ZZZZ
MHRQLDPSSPDVIIGEGADLNTTHRSWTLVGTLGDVDHAAVDSRGLVSRKVDGFSVDWWVGADDRWHLPSRSAGIRQRLVDDSPIVETTMRVPGGEIVHRVWGVAPGAGMPPGGGIVIELHNAATVPVAVAIALRPFGPISRTAIKAIDLDGTVVRVDGHPVMHLAKAPSRVAVGSASLGDSLNVVESGAAGSQWPDGGVRCSEGRASAALLFPLPHTATVRFVLESAPIEQRRSLFGFRHRELPSAPVNPAAAPDASRVAAGWEVQTRRSPRMELLELRADEAVRSARRSALLHAAGDDAVSWSDGLVGVFDACALIIALDQHGLHAEAAKLLMGLVDRIDVDGRFELEHHRVDAGAAWLHAVERHIRLADDVALARVSVGEIAKVAHRVHRDVVALKDRRRARRSTGPVWTTTPESLRVHDLVWAHSGLNSAATALRVAEQPDAAREIEKLAEGLAGEVDAALASAHLTPESAVAAVVALVESDSAALIDQVLLDALVDEASRGAVRGAVVQRIGEAALSPRLTAALAVARIRLGDRNAVEALRWMLEIGAPTWSWPESVHPRTGDGCSGDGHSPVSTAAFLQLTRSFSVIDDEHVVDLFPVVPSEWLGQPIEVHDLPTSHGKLSFAVRWHGERPALLWDLRPHEDVSISAAESSAVPIGLRCTGLDPTWSTTELRGEALLAPPDPDLAASAAVPPMDVEPPADSEVLIDPAAGPTSGSRPPTAPSPGESFS